MICFAQRSWRSGWWDCALKKKKKRSSKLTLESFQLAILSSKTTGHFTKGLRKEKSQNYNSGFEDCGSANYKPKVTASFHQ